MEETGNEKSEQKISGSQQTEWTYEDIQQREQEQMESNAHVMSGFSAGVNEAAGIFMQVNKHGPPLYKHVSGGTLGMRQVNTAGPAIYKPNLFGDTVNGLGKGLWLVALGMEALNVCDAIGEELSEQSPGSMAGEAVATVTVGAPNPY
ncbi:hypothetical protein PFISCL1PPCAC_704 [Pristionchus fissidentatus]|uniref:Uncharacterized protein n=1 Tax=Pristionchus fissidentatus TaxID=1538716 RepID=A0AAV5US61_9BILA|nr:hypothetical protein PFISCL1PPCAC_704 [Pristionchus fissidentatus]